ncbi:MAG: Eco57I restriction-modification methylase domain-containing protein, partial [Candidatus Bipolaricaulia bacterium]
MVDTPKIVLELVERFERNIESYHDQAYNETEVRREFIDPFFEALCWDVSNRAGYAEAYKDVVHEDAIKVGGATKAPDYCFRIGGARKFFVEAKRPALHIKEDPGAAYQLRRYAWSAKLPLSILTNFEEFAVYDCRVKPMRTDKASTARTKYFTYNEYAERWEEIASIFSREALLKGSFDRYAESTKRKRGTAEVDAAFLKEIEDWRELLARNIALRNPQLTQRELNFAVQRTVDRIIFLRICEDRGIEEYGQLMALLNGTQVYPRLCDLFRRADERYNSGLFHFHREKDRAEPPDELTLGLTIDDRLLKQIIKGLYYPDSPYEFSVLPADILGHVYEQFLGKVIHLTPGHRAKVEDKPEVKKAGGVYYTPTYIVDYIVKNTVGKLLEGKTPKQAAKLKILDPACGSGSFLLGAYQVLLDWHRDWYVEHDPERWAKGRLPKLYQGPGGDWRLTTAEKKRILLNNLYGVDIDPQAVEVTKLSLLLKVLEGENEQTLAKHLKLFHERALPDLGDNIKCGNSLIGPDFYEEKQLSLLDEEERYRINAFDWEAEFPDIMKVGGFDVVIGNPPYIRIQAMKEWAPIEVEFYKRRY